MADDAGGLIGRPTTRIDGVAKVTGAARYASDEAVDHPAYAYLVVSSIARGRVRSMDLGDARSVLGVLAILNHENAGGEVASPSGPDDKSTTTTLETDQVWHAGQIVAVVIAETFEAAREAARKVKVTYETGTPAATFGSSGVREEKRPADAKHKDPIKGNFGIAYAAAPIRLDNRYSTPTQHHNPLELFTTTCVWDGPRLTIYEGSQSMYGLRAGVARQLGIDLSNIRTISRYVGGAFGSRGSPTSRTVWIAVAARKLGRPVKLEASRDQGFTIATNRAETRQRLQLGATRDGKLTALSHEGWEVTSRPSNYSVSGTETTTRMYACQNIASAVNIMHADRQTPGFMRAPPDTPYMFALESGMDELAHELGIDPIELRRINDTAVDPINGKPFSSRSLMPCFDAAAAEFGWSRRTAQPGSMRDGEWRIGWGCATSCYPSNIGPAAARLSLDPSGRAKMQLAGHEIGTGAYTTVAIVVADGLGIPVSKVDVLMGDSELPPVTVAGGSNNAATTAHVAQLACEQIRLKIAEAAVAPGVGIFAGADSAGLRLQDGHLAGPDGLREPLGQAIARAAHGPIEVLAQHTPAGSSPEALAELYQGHASMISGTSRKDVAAYAFGAHLVEIRVHDMTREVRATRAVSAFAAGVIVNPLTAYSQFMGGAIWGISSALHEATEIDARVARYVNNNLADYLIPVNADVPDLKIIMLPEADHMVNPMGIKGIGEIGIVGMNAAVANAVFHATGKRIRDLPIRLEQLP